MHLHSLNISENISVCNKHYTNLNQILILITGLLFAPVTEHVGFHDMWKFKKKNTIKSPWQNSLFCLNFADSYCYTFRVTFHSITYRFQYLQKL